MATATQFAYRTLKEIGVTNADPDYQPLLASERLNGSLRCCAYSPCGRFFAWADPESVTIIGTSNGQTLATVAAENVFEIGFSPRGTFIITWQRPSKDQEGNAAKNLLVRKVVGELQDEEPWVGKFVQKSQTGWNLQYTFDEQFCARVVANEVHFYQSQDLGSVWSKLRVEGVIDFAVSPGENHSVAVFVPQRKGSPASVRVFSIPNFSSPVSQKNFFKGDKVQMKWNAEGTSLIVLAQTEVDKSGKSYYGETTMYILSANGGFDSRIDLDKDGPIHDVTWSPSSKQFGVVYGYMPAKTTIFDTRAQATHSFPLGPRNTILFSPQGRFVLVAGFGNLAGQIDIYDLEKDYQKLCTIEASNASICKWSPDGQQILTATTSPRLRVDNGIRIWHVSGQLLYNQDLRELYHVNWRPKVGTAPPAVNPCGSVPKAHASAIAYLGTVKTPLRPAGAYRPPGARGQLTPLAFKREDQGGEAFVSNGTLSNGLHANIFGKPRRREVLGAEPVTEDRSGMGSLENDADLSKAAMKNKKKREAKKAKEIAEKAVGLAPIGDHNQSASSQSVSRSPERRDRNSHPRNRSRGAPTGKPINHIEQKVPPVTEPSPPLSHDQLSQKERVPESPTPNPSPPVVTVAPPTNGNAAQDKKIRALLKKLRAIDDLKMRRAGGEKLEGTQIKKMDTEDDVRRELETLGWVE